MAGRTSSQVITRYAGVQVQTSALGVNIPVGWGTFRCKCNLLDYLDFKAKAQHASGKGGGKGGQVTTGYSYSASLVMGICEGPIDAISAIYVNSTVYTNGSRTALAQVGLGAALGSVGQAPWSYLTSNHPTHAIGYSGLAIVHASNYGLDAGAVPPNHSFEVVRLAGFGVSGSEDADPSRVVVDFFENSRTGVPGWPASGLLGDLTAYQTYCLAAGLLVSPVIDQQRSGSDFITELLKATNSTCVWSEGVLKFIPYGDTALTGNGKSYTPNNSPVYALGDDDFVQDKPGDPVLQVDIEDQSDAYNVIQLEYLDRTNQYNMAIALASDAANVAQYGMRRKDPDTVHCVCDPKVAAISAQLFLQRTLYIRAQYRFKLGWMFALLEPGDIVALTDPGAGLAAYPVRVIQIDQDEKYGLSFVCEDYPVGVGHTPLYDMQTGGGFAADQNVDPGGVEANLLLWSGDQTNAVWTPAACSVTAAAANDPYGLPTACAIVTAATSASHYIVQNVAAFAAVPYTFAVCLQQNAHKIAQIQMTDAVTSGVYLTVDLSTGLVTSSGAYGTTSTFIGASVGATLVAGIWRLSLTGEFSAITTMSVLIEAFDDLGNQVWTGDGAAAINVSQAQLRQGVAAGAYAATTTAAAGPWLFNPPSALATRGEIWAAVAGGPDWGGAYVWTSADGASYQQVGVINGPARYGVATTAFPAAADPDTTDSLGVDLGVSDASLSGASQANADNGATMCLIDGELIAYQDATLTNPGRYTLGTSIRRGYLNTPIAAHAAGAPFARIDEAIFQFPYLASNIGQAVYVKFQSFNLFGRALADLSACIAYPCTPLPAAAAAPAASAWTAIGTTLSNNGQSLPAILITGASDNPSATAIEFDYRVTGSAAWISSGTASNSATQRQITSVQSGQTYDVSVLYLVNGAPSGREIVASGITVGAIVGQAVPGTVLINDSAPGARTITLPPGAYGHVDISLWGPGGAGFGSTSTYYGTPIYYGGGGGENRVVLSVPVTPGSTTITYTLSATPGGACTVSATGPFTAMTANGGTSASLGYNGVGGSGGSGGAGTNGTSGHNGSGYVISASGGYGGGAGNGGGNSTGAGSTPGGGGLGNGASGAGGAITVTARA